MHRIAYSGVFAGRAVRVLRARTARGETTWIRSWTRPCAGLALLKVRNIRHWTDRTFSFNCERPASFRFRSGEFAMIGLMVDGKPLVRAYSIASPSWDEELEFYSIKVAGRPADLAAPASGARATRS